MKSETGYLLTKIAAIINFIISAIIFIMGLGILIFVWGLDNEKINPIVIFLIAILISLIILIFGLLELKASNKMKNPKTTRNGAIWAIVLGALTIGNLSGILSLIGGIIGLTDSNRRK